MSVKLKLNPKKGLYFSLPLVAMTAISTTFAFAQYAQMANNTQITSNNVPQGMARTATIQECAQACAANMSCGSFVYYTQAAMANVCQLTSSQTPLNVVGAISGVPHRSQSMGAPTNTPINATSPQKTTATNYQNVANNQNRGTGNYAVTPLPYGSAANTPNWNARPNPQPQVQYNPQTQQAPQGGAISFVRPENNQQQQGQMQKYNPQPQYQPQASYQPQQYKPAPAPQPQQYQQVPVTQVQTYAPTPAPQQQYSYAQPTNTPQQSYSANDVNYQSHSKQPVPEYSVARATEQANQQLMQQQALQQQALQQQAAQQQAAQQNIDAAAKPVREANLGPLRPSAKTQMEYDKYRDKDGMVDAAAMRRDMLKNEKSPRYSVESEWQGIAQTSDANQAAKIYENSAPVPLPPEVSEKDILTEDTADAATKPKKKGLFSKIFKRELDEYAEPASEDSADNNQNDGPLRRK